VADVDALIDRGDLPKVEEWKRAMLTYKQNSISLGVIDPPSRGSAPEGPYSQQEAPPPLPGPDRAPSPECLPEGILLSADVVSFHYEMEEYWFRLDAIFQPYGPPGQNRLPSAKQLILFRVYNDFYDFQVSLLNTFPREAGRQPPHPRTLPYMPGPAKDVDDALTATRRQELDEYIHGLCALGKSGGRYILEHNTIRQFLALKPGDVENEIEPRVREVEALLGVGDNYPDEDDLYAGEDDANDVNDQLGRVNLKDNRRSDGSEYEDEGYAPSPQQRPIDRHPYSQPSDKYDRQLSREENLRMQAHANHSRAGSTASFHTQHSTTFGQSRSHSPHKERNPSPTPPRNSEQNSAQSRWADSTTYNGTAASTASFRSSNSSRSRSHSNATANNNLTHPPISAANPQTAFVKIKIFVADDLIAIRVHPKVTHSELMEKVQSRLGLDIGILKYQDSSTNTFVGLDTDEELRSWMEGTDKHVLYAD
jgi:bud emergence protein 1